MPINNSDWGYLWRIDSVVENAFGLLEDPGLIPRIYTVAHNCLLVSRYPTLFSDLCGYQACVWYSIHSNTQGKYSYT